MPKGEEEKNIVDPPKKRNAFGAASTLKELYEWREKHSRKRAKDAIKERRRRNKQKDKTDPQKTKAQGSRRVVPRSQETSSKAKLQGQELLSKYEQVLNSGGTLIKAAIECGWDYKEELGWFKQAISKAREERVRPAITELNFKKWLETTSLSESSQYKYLTAIKGKVSKLCIEYGITSSEIFSTQNPELFQDIRECLEGDEEYISSNTKGKDMYKRALDYYSHFLEENISSQDKNYEGVNTKTLLTTEASSIIKSRIGQGKYRQRLEKYWNNCCSVTGLQDSTHGSLLTASHIKPWSISTNTERLDVFNGLLLIPNLDKSFDTGYITFNNEGKILISPLLKDPHILGITPLLCLPPNKLTEKHREYLSHHREVVFKEKLLSQK